MIESKKDVSDLIKTRGRVKDFGEVYTPLNLVRDMLSEIPQKTWCNPNKTFFEPACGNGNFLIEVVKKKIDNGVSPIDAIIGTYGVDIIYDNVIECRVRLLSYVSKHYQIDLRGVSKILSKNIKHGNALEFSVEDIFSDSPSERLIAFRQENKKEISLEELQILRKKYLDK